MHGGADQLTSVAASREFAAGIKGDCTFQVWDGYYHELHNEPQNGEFYDFLVAWLNEHLK
jgi:alpha-beta hydrolase superfamily lysophospholipase